MMSYTKHELNVNTVITICGSSLCCYVIFAFRTNFEKVKNLLFFSVEDVNQQKLYIEGGLRNFLGTNFVR